MADTRIRRVRESDVDSLVQLVHDLAAYEKAPAECRLTAEKLRVALFGDSPAVFGHVAEEDGRIVGFAIWFLNFSTWRGVHGIYLEDLYVRPELRGSGLGKALLATLAKECVDQGYQRLEWSVLDWNPATGFYKSLGALPMDEWTVYRLTDTALDKLAKTV
ncbi:GNAT family N-acetyltransferase [Amycolatopsis acidiphila]|uniref:GNAT family N-acetyltransferase n=1 Tax=Amycolatopsis acidiphila TaxID=715473 RepID=A0A558A1N0_9PSEU|nr:GNAT family N-acetyltransferase [Amycolatopsis acidiphila]TVT18171.1 GNAT family N-acetyltransferase [Amycolatopsis acidiphila]UIJ58877.1 GNAT family N-acetyltransferase [Amycolatopsis acidiphila]GHG72495.1 N-acetyltransferase [Amycolatopsis acidiphila]